MKKFVFLALLIIVVYFIVLGVQDSIERSQAEVMTIEKYQEANGIPVVTSRVTLQNLAQLKSYTGSIRGIEQADASAMIMEKIDKLNVSPGASVSKNQLLLTLDRQNPSARFRQAKDSLDETKKDLERNKELLDAGAISQQVYDKSVLAVNIAQADFDAVVRTLEVRAPIGGIVTDVYFENGETVSPGAPIVRIAKLDKVLVEIEVGEREVPLIKKGQKANVTARSYENETFQGTVHEIALSKDPEARNYLVKIVISNPDMKLRPDMFTIVNIIMNESNETIAVPTDAVVSENGTAFVYKVGDNKVAVKTEVTLGIAQETWVEVVDGLSIDDMVVIEGHNRLKDGAKVIIENN